MSSITQHDKAGRLKKLRADISMNKKLFIFSVGLLISINGIAAGPISLNQCTDWTRNFNASLPKRIDEITVISSAACAIGSTKPAKSVYKYNLAVEKRDLTDLQLEKLRLSQLNYWCSDSEHRNLLKMVDVEFIYFDKNSVLLFGFETTQRRCN